LWFLGFLFRHFLKLKQIRLATFRL
jgi:hypothetical protein